MSGPYGYSKRSAAQLATCAEPLQRLFNEVIRHRDCVIITGHRGEEEQNAAFDIGHSKVRWPDGKHNKTPSQAADVMAYPVDWRNRGRNLLFAGFVLGAAAAMGIGLRNGADWDGDGDPTDQNFHDPGHFELIET